MSLNENGECSPFHCLSPFLHFLLPSTTAWQQSMEKVGRRIKLIQAECPVHLFIMDYIHESNILGLSRAEEATGQKLLE